MEKEEDINMFCGNCGAKMEDNAKFCPSCGAKNVTYQEESVQPSGEPGTRGQSPAAGNRNKLVGIGAVLAAVLVLIILLFGGNGYEKTVKKYFKAFEKNDPQILYDITAQYWIKYADKGFYDGCAMDTIEDTVEDTLDDWDCGDKVRISYDIVSKRKATREELEDLEDIIYEWYAYYVYDRDEFSISAAYVLDIDFTVKGNEDTADFTISDGLLVIKENGKWKVTRGYLSSDFLDD